MALKTFFISLFLLSIAAIFLLKPHRAFSVDKKGIPQIEFIDFNSFDISTSGIKSMGHGVLGKKYRHEMQIESPFYRWMVPKGIESVAAEKGIYHEDKSIILKQDVRIKRSDGWVVKTPFLYADLRKKIYTTQRHSFTAMYGKSIVTGKSMIYYQKDGKIKAKMIHAVIGEK